MSLITPVSFDRTWPLNGTDLIKRPRLRQLVRGECDTKFVLGCEQTMYNKMHTSLTTCTYQNVNGQNYTVPDCLSEGPLDLFLGSGRNRVSQKLENLHD